LAAEALDLFIISRSSPLRSLLSKGAFRLVWKVWMYTYEPGYFICRLLKMYQPVFILVFFFQWVLLGYLILLWYER